MSEATAIDADETLLDELAGLLMSAARMAHARMEAASDDQAFNAAGQTLHRMARSLRQTLALKGKLARERDEAGRKAQARAESDRSARIHRKKAQVSAVLERAIWDEHEDDDSAEDAIARLDELLDEAALSDGFLEEPVEPLITRLAETLGYHVQITQGGVQATPPHAHNTADTS